MDNFIQYREQGTLHRPHTDVPPKVNDGKSVSVEYRIDYILPTRIFSPPPLLLSHNYFPPCLCLPRVI